MLGLVECREIGKTFSFNGRVAQNLFFVVATEFKHDGASWFIPDDREELPCHGITRSLPPQASLEPSSLLKIFNSQQSTASFIFLYLEGLICRVTLQPFLCSDQFLPTQLFYLAFCICFLLTLAFIPLKRFVESSEESGESSSWFCPDSERRFYHSWIAHKSHVHFITVVFASVIVQNKIYLDQQVIRYSTITQNQIIAYYVVEALDVVAVEPPHNSAPSMWQLSQENQSLPLNLNGSDS